MGSESTNAQNAPARRTAHSYAGALYLLPSDEEERQRLLKQHKLYTRLLSNRLIFPPISPSGEDEILDIGTGGGAWICDVCTHLPNSVQLYGIDIESRLFPTPPSNVHFSICSGTDLPSYWNNKFALIHQRLLIFAYTRDQWLCAIREMYRTLAPGGYVQLIEIGPEWVSGPKTAKLMLFLDDFIGSKGMLMRCGVYVADMLKAAGFVDVKTEEAVMNLGKWAGEDGKRGRDVLIGACKGLRDSVLEMGSTGPTLSDEEFTKMSVEVPGEWDDTEGSHATVRAFYGRKPL